MRIRACSLPSSDPSATASRPRLAWLRSMPILPFQAATHQHHVTRSKATASLSHSHRGPIALIPIHARCFRPPVDSAMLDLAAVGAAGFRSHGQGSIIARWAVRPAIVRNSNARPFRLDQASDPFMKLTAHHRTLSPSRRMASPLP